MSTIRCVGSPRLISFVWISLLLALWLSPLTAGAANLTGLSLSPQDPILNVGNSVQMTAIGSYDNGIQQPLKQAKQVSTSGGQTCSVASDGTVRCWGLNNHGQLGNGSTTDSFTPVTVSGINAAVSVSAGGYHTCALGTLTSGATAKVTITIKPQTTGTITNSASVTATESDPNTGNNSASAATLVKK